MPSSSIPSESTSYGGSSDDSNGLMVSFPSRPRIRIHKHNPRPSHRSDASDSSVSASSSEESREIISETSVRTGARSRTSRPVNAEVYARNEKKHMKGGDIESGERNHTNEDSEVSTGTEEQFDTSSLYDLSVHFKKHSLLTDDGRSSISCSSTSDATSARHDASSKSLWSSRGEMKKVITIARVQEGGSGSNNGDGGDSNSNAANNDGKNSNGKGSSGDGNGNRAGDSNGGGDGSPNSEDIVNGNSNRNDYHSSASNSSSSAAGSLASVSSSAPSRGSSTSGSSSSSSNEASEKTGGSQVSTSGGIPYPTASKKRSSLVFYGWGDISRSESNFGSEAYSYRTSSENGNSKGNRNKYSEGGGDGNSGSNRMLFAEFQDRHRYDCGDVSLTESQTSNIILGGEINVEDEYDPKRPWKKKPLGLHGDTNQNEGSEGSFTMSALSNSDAGTVFVDVSMAGMGTNHETHSTINTNKDESNPSKEDLSNPGDLDVDKVSVANKDPNPTDDEDKSNNSFRSSLNSDISELNVAKKALEESSHALSNTLRQSYPKGGMFSDMSISSKSDFTLTTQAFRKPEPFRPGPGNPRSQSFKMHRASSTVTMNTLDMMYEETGRTLGVVLPKNPPPRPRYTKHHSSFSGTSSIATLPSIIENNDLSVAIAKQTSDLTVETDVDTEASNQGFILADKRKERRVSELTTISMEETEPRAAISYYSSKENRKEFRTQTSNDSSSDSATTEDQLAILRASDKLEKGKTARLFPLNETEEDQPLNNDFLQGIDNRFINQYDSEKFDRSVDQYDSEKFGFLSAGGNGVQDNFVGDHSIADSSMDELEHTPISRESTRSLRSPDNRPTSLTYRIYKCNQCCRRFRVRMGRCCPENRKHLVVSGTLAIIFIATILAVFFAIVIPGLNQTNGAMDTNMPSSTPSTSPSLSSSPSSTLSPSLSSTPTLSPSLSSTPTLGSDSSSSPTSPSLSSSRNSTPRSPTISPTQLFTLWPTATDTYKQKYPPPP